MKYKKSRTPRLPLLRYLFPVFSHLLLFFWMLIPSVRFQVGTEQPRQSLSVWDLLQNTWQVCRDYLFSSTSEKNAYNDMFSTVALVLLAVFALLFLLGVAASVWSLLAAADAMRGKDNGTAPGKIRRMLVAILPNRVLLLTLQAMVIPLSAFPHLLPLLYERYLLLPTYLTYVFFPPVILAVLLWLVTLALTLWSRKQERICGVDPFSLAAFRAPKEEAKEAEEPKEEEPTSTLYRMKKESAEEQTQRLRRLLGYDTPEEDPKNSDESHLS